MGLALSHPRAGFLVLVAALVAYLRRRAQKKQLKASSSSFEAMPPMPTRAPPRADGTAVAVPTKTAQGVTDVLEAVQRRGDGWDVEYWICLDFEWTCDEGRARRVHSDEGEIIEFAYAVYDAVKDQVVTQGQYYIKNQKTPITEFCVTLTGISDKTLKDAGTLEDALLAFSAEMERIDAESKRCCAMAHGSADLELMLPNNCKAAGLEVPKVLRNYVDLREATQTHLVSQGILTQPASSLSQICSSLGVEMQGQEHCGLDDSLMVMRATQALLNNCADLRAIDLDREREEFLELAASTEQSLVLDGLSFSATASMILPWLLRCTGFDVPASSLWVVLEHTGKPSGRAVVDFRAGDAAIALKALDGGKCLTVELPEGPKERLVLARPLRWHERTLPRLARVAGDVEGNRQALVRFPANADELEQLRRSSRAARPQMDPATGVVGRVRKFDAEKGFGFIACEAGGEVFVHKSACREQLFPGMSVKFDIIMDRVKNKTKAMNVKMA